jgi:hypothetical protein
MLTKTSPVRSALLLLLLVACPAVVAGCEAMALPFLLWGDAPTKQVEAEYPYLPGKKVCLLVWAEPETLFAYPDVQYELSQHIIHAMKSPLPNVSFIPSKEVIALQKRDARWDRSDPAELGSRFGADRTLVVNVSQYSTREPDSPHLYRGRIFAEIRVYDCAYRDREPNYKGTIQTVYPEDSPGKWGSNDRTVRKAAMEAFGEDVARKFYDHKVKVK